MAVIHVLDKHTAELIAAGEVVERPASVVKELLENAIDAGATQITVAIESGGVKLIEVSDNGSGIEAEYISTAFIRHATSKIRCAADLEGIHTLGFRGEALASIASVARVEVLTRTELDEFACCYRIEGGEELGMEPGARGVGTTIRVKDLFYNTPARMKFLKKDASEGTFVADIVGHVALSHPEVGFKFIREGKLQYVTAGDGKLLSAAYAILGREFARDLLAVDYTTGHYRVHGLVTPPKSCRASRSMQYFYINNRYVKNRTMMAALETAYKGTLMHGKFPGGLLMLEMPAELVDVNVHPAKTEVRFARENDIFDAVYHTVKSVLAQPGSGERMFRFDAAPAAGESAAAEKNAAAGAAAALNPAAAVRSSGTTVPAAARTDNPQNAAPSAAAAKQKAGESSEEKDILPFPEKASKDPVPGGKTPVVIPASAPLPVRGLGLRSPTAGLPLASENEYLLDIRPEHPEEMDPPATAAIHSAAAADPAPAASHSCTSSAAAPMREETEKRDPVEPDASSAVVSTVDAPAAAAPCVQQDAVNAKPDTLRRTAQSSLADAPAQTALWDETQPEPLRYVGEVFKTYIITQRGSELCIIDKHAAHERILYEQLAATYGNVAQQMLLAPEVVTLSAEEKQAVLENLELLDQAGLEVDDFGGNSVVVRAVPCDVEPHDIAALLVELAAKLTGGGKDALNARTEWVLHSIACRAAIKAGDRTAPEQLLHLAEEILSGKVPPFCPHGRPCVLKLTRKELEKQFGRIV